MTLSQIQCFLVVADKMSITEAANELFVTQPAVSHRISKLEQELGARLFFRDNSKIILTSAGRKYVDFFKKFVSEMERIANELKEENVVAQTIVVGCADGWDISDIVKELKSLLRQECPGIDVKLDCCGNEEFISKIRNNSVDIAFGYEGVFLESKTMRVKEVGRVWSALIYSADHPALKNGEVSLLSFRDYPFYVISSPKNTFMATEIYQSCLAHGFTPKIEFVGSISAAMLKMRTEYGVMVGDDYIINDNSELYNKLRLDYKRKVCVGIKNNASEAELVVKNILESLCSEKFGK